MKYIYTLLFVAISATSFAQGNLQFNKVVSFNGSISGNIPFMPLDTVGVGKVVKITSFNSNGIPSSVGIRINDLGSLSNGTYSFPIWLKQGDVLAISSSFNGNYGYHVSGIEFNIIP